MRHVYVGTVFAGLVMDPPTGTSPIPTNRDRQHDPIQPKLSRRASTTGRRGCDCRGDGRRESGHLAGDRAVRRANQGGHSPFAFGTMAISETTLKDVMLMLIEKQNSAGGLLGRKLEPSCRFRHQTGRCSRKKPVS